MGKWLTTLKSEKAPATHPAKPAEPPFAGFAGYLPRDLQKNEMGSAGFAGYPPGAFGNSPTAPEPDATHPAKPAEPPKPGSSFATITGLEGASPDTVEQFRAASAALDALAASAPDADPDRWCWPHGDAMNGAEIDTFTARLARFTGKGLGLEEAERMADALVQRDRQADDRRTCLECNHLGGFGPWRCGNWQRAQIAMQAWDNGLPRALATTLQRCPGFGGQSINT